MGKGEKKSEVKKSYDQKKCHCLGGKKTDNR